MKRIISNLLELATTIRIATQFDNLPDNLLQELRGAVPPSEFSSLIKSLLSKHTIQLLQAGLRENPNKIGLAAAATLAHFIAPDDPKINNLKREITLTISRLNPFMGAKEKELITTLLKYYLFGLDFYSKLGHLSEEQIAEILPHEERYAWLMEQHGAK